jgi:TPR repeat protein
MAQNSVGVMYRDGEGLEPDPAEAAKWFRKSAKQGFGEAQLSLGAMLLNGNGVSVDYVESYAWLYLSFLKGNQTARQLLGEAESKLKKGQLKKAQKLAKKLVK